MQIFKNPALLKGQLYLLISNTHTHTPLLCNLQNEFDFASIKMISHHFSTSHWQRKWFGPLFALG